MGTSGSNFMKRLEGFGRNQQRELDQLRDDGRHYIDEIAKRLVTTEHENETLVQDLEGIRRWMIQVDKINADLMESLRQSRNKVKSLESRMSLTEEFQNRGRV